VRTAMQLESWRVRVDCYQLIQRSVCIVVAVAVETFSKGM
jgi:hypothetical protein